MFCKNCGKELPDGSQFCSGCGQPIAAVTPTPAPAPVPAPASAGMPPFLKNFLNQLKALVNPYQAVGLAAQSTGFEGVIGAGLYVLIYALYYAVVNDTELYNFGALFGLSLITGLLYVGFLYGGLFLMTVLAHGKPANPLTVLNVVGIVLIPTCAATLLNTGLNFIWWGLSSFVSNVAYLFLIIMLYVAIEKMGKPVRSYLWIFCAVIALAFVLDAIFSNLIMDAYYESVFSSPFGGSGSYSDYSDYMDELGDLFGY